MHLDSETYQYIDLYLERKLSGFDLIEFENKLQTNILIKNKYVVLLLTNQLILELKLDELKSRMRTELKNSI